MKQAAVSQLGRGERLRSVKVKVRVLPAVYKSLAQTEEQLFPKQQVSGSIPEWLAVELVGDCITITGPRKHTTFPHRVSIYLKSGKEKGRMDDDPFGPFILRHFG